MPHDPRMKRQLSEEYGDQSATSNMYGGKEGIGTSAGNAKTLKEMVGRKSSAQERIHALQEANKVSVRNFLQDLHDRLQEKGEGQKRIFEGGPGKGISFLFYDEIFGEELGNVTAVEYSAPQYAKLKAFAQQWMEGKTNGFTEENTFFIDDPESFFAENPEVTYADLAKLYKFVLVYGDALREAERSGGNSEYDAAVLIESIIHMNRDEVVAALMKILSEGALMAFTDIGLPEIFGPLASISTKLLSERANIKPTNASWWKKHYPDSLIALIDKSADQKATAWQLARMYMDPQMYEQVIRTLTEKGGMTLSKARQTYAKDFVLFVTGAPIVTTYEAILQKKPKKKEEQTD